MMLEISDEERRLLIRALTGLVDELARWAPGVGPVVAENRNFEGRRARIAEDLADRIRRL